jgi:hypothetical protein
MDDHQKMRASDGDRQEVVERLRVALDDGRLKLDEYLDRMGHAYEAVTYGDLDPLTSDLPRTRSMAERETSATVPAAAPFAGPHAEVAKPGFFAGLPAPLRVVWTAWLIAVSVNVVVWILVCVTAGQLVYPWPLWVAGPWGAVLLGLSVAARASHNGRPYEPPHQPPP